MNEIAYTKLIQSIVVSGKVAFNKVKGWKIKDYPDGNVFTAWERLKNEYESISGPSLVMLEKQFRELSLKKGQDPEIWITELVEIRMKLEVMGSSISENQFMIHILTQFYYQLWASTYNEGKESWGWWEASYSWRIQRGVNSNIWMVKFKVYE